ncbi:hypothetical protein BX666DRAFT_1967603 [Dichotomocladium elegans]|nr:hypothetical protein BX666DRAFT_1967603 [Dichotomocladium elegans]
MTDRDVALANYMLASIQKDLEFLKDQQFLNPHTYNEVMALLPSRVDASKKPPLPTRKSGTNLVGASEQASAAPLPATREGPKLPVRRSTSDTNNQPPKPSPRLTPQQPHAPPRTSPRISGIGPQVMHMPSPAQQQPEPAFRKQPLLDTQPEQTPPPAYSAASTPPVTPHLATVEAIYDYQSDDPSTDLVFRRGDVIIVTEYVNDDWWRGELNGKSGIFPQNHVQKIASPKAAKRVVPSKPSPASVYQAPATHHTVAPYQSYNTSSTAPPYNYPPPPTQMYQAPPPASSSYGAPPPVIATTTTTVNTEEEGGSKVQNMAKKFGSNVANAAVWGFGATVGAEAAHAIF